MGSPRRTAFVVSLVGLTIALGLVTFARVRAPIRGEATGADPVAVEQGRIAGTRLTRPFIEDPGVRDGDARLRTFVEQVEAAVARERASDPSLQVSVYLRQLEGGAWTGLDEDVAYVPASLMKVAVLFHALARLEADPTLAERSVVYPGPQAMPSPDNLAGAGDPRHLEVGRAYSFVELVERMVAYSDNHAKDLVLTGVDPAEIDALMDAVGVPGQTDARGRAVMSARSYAALFRLLYHSSVFSRSTSEFALDLLRRADFAEGLRAGLPHDVVVASKYGVHFDPDDLDAGQQLHECGIVYAPGEPFTLCVMTRSLIQPQDALAGLVAQVAREAWFALANPVVPPAEETPRGGN